ncbi:4a-hydroxytetrahydrobiopterin dehydratase [Ramlibacter albus]|uniref:Putative pterin-4-alpha-carbinolamine dehydratase n=1 Tax=Ramlibacter albus TaxID=2079448 RepID=A0A923M9V4_9BURK|nr:4a-hydroxytetrahydrobiopterin dehydratase [Ramlibacter albus]MBC5766030.1 4a-hydroxytetrahydrobiopterin dehydratase [Ramlibacter albus]
MTARRALSPTEVVTRLSKLGNGWALAGSGDNTAIEKTFKFANYHETISFVNAVAFIANKLDHHPDLSVHYSRCVVRWRTHEPPGISALDFDAAARIEALSQ